MRMEESFWMRLCRKLGWTRLAWSLRRLHCPVAPDALVLEVGSGGNPYFRSNVLLDAFEVTQQRHWAPLVADRATVLGAVEHLPFRDKSFDFVIASHVFEHSTQPELFLRELQRVAKAGYIEVPDALMERLNPYRDHRLEITVRDGVLLVRKKPDWRTDPVLVELFDSRGKKWISGETIPKHPFDFHVRYYWDEHIDFTVLNPEVDADWAAPTEENPGTPRNGLRARVNKRVLQLARSLFSQRKRNIGIKLDDLLACPECRSADLHIGAERIACRSCHAEYPVRNGLPAMFVKH
jgi:SAM-dependent methyltransferase